MIVRGIVLSYHSKMKQIFQIFVLLICIGSPALSMAYGASPEEPLRIEWRVKHAFDHFNERYKGQTKELADEHLRLFVLRAETPETIKIQRDLLLQQKRPADFIEHFDAAVKWLQSFELDDGSRAYALSKAYKKRTDNKVYNGIWQRLRWLSETKQYPPALFEAAERRFNSPKQIHWQMGCSILQRLAKSGKVAAALELGRRYKDGDNLLKDNELALYWLTKAQLIYMGNDPALNQQQKKIRSELATGSVPDERKKEIEDWFSSILNRVSPNLNSWQTEVLQRISAEDLRSAEVLVRASNLMPTCHVY